MKTLTAPARNDQMDYTEVIAARKSPRVRRVLGAIQERIFAAYANYPTQSNIGAIAPMAWNGDESKELRKCYETLMGSSRPYLAAYRDVVFAVPQYGRCPYCGFARVGSIDHYLPKETFPEFSVYAGNLIAVCKDCNNAKGAHSSVDPNQQTIHPYFDMLPDSYLLEVHLSFNNELQLGYVLNLGEQPLNDSLLRLNFHFVKLGLAEKYEHEALTELGGQRMAYARYFERDESGNVLREELANQRESWEAEFGKVHWKVALYRALEGSEEFCTGGYARIR